MSDSQPLLSSWTTVFNRQVELKLQSDAKNSVYA